MSHDNVVTILWISLCQVTMAANELDAFLMNLSTFLITTAQMEGESASQTVAENIVHKLDSMQLLKYCIHFKQMKVILK